MAPCRRELAAEHVLDHALSHVNSPFCLARHHGRVLLSTLSVAFSAPSVLNKAPRRLLGIGKAGPVLHLPLRPAAVCELRGPSQALPLARVAHPRWQQMVNGEWTGFEETEEEFSRGVVSTIESLIERHESQRIAIVCHGGVINAYVSHCLGLPNSRGFFYPNYTSIHRIAAARSGERSIVTLNETSHLRLSGLPMGLFQKSLS